MSPDFITAFTGGLTGMAPIGALIFLYIYLNSKRQDEIWQALTKRQDKQEEKFDEQDKELRVIQLRVAGDERMEKKLQVIEKDIDRLKNQQTGRFS